MFIEQRGAYHVALLVKEPRKRSDERAGVIGLGDVAGAEAHRAAGVHEQEAAEIGFLLEFFEKVPVGAGKDAPVEIAEVVAGRILAIFGKLDGEAGERAAMQTGANSLHDRARAQLEIADR